MSEHKQNERINTLILEQILLQLSEFDARMKMLEGGKVTHQKRGSSISQLRAEIDSIKKLATIANERAGRMRLDRQIKLGLKFFVRRIGIWKDPAVIEQKKQDNLRIAVLREKEVLAKEMTFKMTITSDVILFCPVYPGGSRPYGGQFIQRRAEAYKKANINVVVVEVSPANTIVQRHTVGDIEVLRLNAAGIQKTLRLSSFNKIAVHQLEKHVWEALRPYASKKSVTVWVHGFEARDWRALSFNFTAKDLETLAPRLEQANLTRRATMKEVFEHEDVKLVFVSQYMREVAEEFVGEKAKNASVIHNSIAESDFPYVEKVAADRMKVLWVRSFSAMNYAHDISTNFILGMSEKPYFKDMKFSIYGDGKFFEEAVAPLRDFDNVHIEQRFLDFDELREAHKEHGVIIVPTRWDSQGLTCGEAMHSGLVPLTNKVAAIPEFVNAKVGILANADDHLKLIRGMDELVKRPKKYLQMSKAAAQRSKDQCGVDKTLEKEIALLR